VYPDKCPHHRAPSTPEGQLADLQHREDVSGAVTERLLQRFYRLLQTVGCRNMEGVSSGRYYLGHFDAMENLAHISEPQIPSNEQRDQ